MTKILSSLLLFSFLLLPAVALGTVPPEIVPPDLDVILVLNDIVDWLFTILLVIAAIAIVIAAFYFVTAGGDPERTAKARQFVLYALIGVAVAIAARGLVILVRMIVEN